MKTFELYGATMDNYHPPLALGQLKPRHDGNEWCSDCLIHRCSSSESDNRGKHSRFIAVDLPFFLGMHHLVEGTWLAPSYEEASSHVMSAVRL